MTLKHSNAITFLSLLLLIIALLFLLPLTITAEAVEPTIVYDANDRSNEYGEVFWSGDSAITIKADGRVQIRGNVSGSSFSKNITGNLYLVYEPYGRMSGSSDMVKLTDATGMIIAAPGTYELSVSPTLYPTNNHADILDSEDNVVYSKVYFSRGHTYTVAKREIKINVDQREELLRYYGGPTVDLNYIFETGSKQMVNGDVLEVEFSSAGNSQDASVGEYDIVMDTYSVSNAKTQFYNVVYSDNRPKLNVEKYVIVATGVGSVTDYYRYDGIHSEAFIDIYEEIPGINDETVRIYYTLDEDNITRVNGALPVNLDDGYPTIVDYDRLEVYCSLGCLVDSRDNYEIDSSANDTRLMVEKRDITLYTLIGHSDEQGVFIDNSYIKETYGFVVGHQFDRIINVLGEDIEFVFSLTEYESIPQAGEHDLTLINADNDFYNITLDESFRFVIDKYTLNLADYMEQTEDTAYIDIAYGEGLLEYSDSIAVDEAFEIVTFTLFSEVDELSYPGEYGFAAYQDNRNFIIDYANVVIRVARKPITINVISPRPTGIEYGDDYYFELDGVIAAWSATLTTMFCEGMEFNPVTAIEGIPINAGSYRIRASIDLNALDFYSFGEEGDLDFAFNIARRNIVVKYILNQDTKEYNTELDINNLGYIIHYYDQEPSVPGLINEDTLVGSGSVTCLGLSNTAVAGNYVVNTSNLGNNNYNIVGGSVKVFYNEIETPSLTVTKLRAENLPAFNAVITSYNAKSVALSNIAINGVSVGGFAISTNGATYSNYQSSNTFNNLTEGKKYYFKVRILGNSNIEQGPESAPINQITMINMPTVKTTSYTVDTVTIELNTITAADMTYTYFYRLGNGEWGESGIFDNLESGTRYQIRYKCVSVDNQIGSAVGSLYLWTVNSAPVVNEDIEIIVASNRIAFDGFTEDYEYRIGINDVEEDIEFSDWTSTFDFEGLLGETEYVVQMRVRASALTGNIAGEALSMILLTPETIIEIPPLSYDGIMQYVAKYYLAGVAAFMFLLMIIFIIGFSKKFSIV